MSDPGPSRPPAPRSKYYSDDPSEEQIPRLGTPQTFQPWWTGRRQPGQAPTGVVPPESQLPYELKTIVKANNKGKYYPSPSQCVEFFPFVGTKRPKSTRSNRNWDKWEDAVVICSGPKVFVGRCADDAAGACWVPIWQFTIERSKQKAEDLYHATWTINPFTLQPVVIAGGELGLIYVLDPVGKKLVRILKGHGDHVQALAVCPTMPHILASGSRDHTMRIWNLYGHEVELPPGQPPHQNYPMGDADEGNHIVAILCGNWPGGHRDAVCAVSWLPTHRAISTASRDNAFKIWALPVLPPPNVPKPDRDYRPVLVHLPLFSTNRISKGPIDSFMWLNEDIVVARCVGAVVTFQWLSYRRYFERGTWAPLGDSVTAVPDSVQWHDVNDSRSITIFSTYKVKGKHTYQRAGFHSAFTPTPDERKSFVADPNLVQGFLVAIPRPGVIPEIILYAPTLAPPDTTPRLRRKLRVDNEDLSDDEEVKKERESGAGEGRPSVPSCTSQNRAGARLGSTPLSKGAGAQMVGPAQDNHTNSFPHHLLHPDLRPRPPSPPESIDGKESPDESSDSGTVSESDLSSGSVVDSDLDDNDEDDDSRRGPFDSDGESRDVGSSDRSSPIASPSSQDERPPNNRHTPHSKVNQYQWRLKADIWGEIVEKHANKGYPLALGTRHESVISCCAISPRGAKWVLGVGDAESIFVWRVKDA